MELRTEIQIPGSSFKMHHGQKIYLTGSCFSENIQEKFTYCGFSALANSHGIIYNPFSIHQGLHDLAHSVEYTLKDLQLNGEKYFSYNHHGSFSDADPNEVLRQINENITTHRTFIQKASVVFITLGTAWIYTEKKLQQIVANCHKLPSSQFTKSCMLIEDIHRTLELMIEHVHLMNPNAHIVFTLSPVKHLKDGFVENQLSKSMLHVAIQQQLGEKVSYFPAYEIMNDDLRDYRFWKEDMIHPNQLAINYIWEKLSLTYFDAPTIKILEEVTKLRQFLDHRPLSNDPDKIALFNQEKEKKKQEFLKKYPELNL